MYKKILKKLLKNESVSDKEFAEFIVEYIKTKNKPEPTRKQLETIMKLAFSSQLDIDYIINEAAKDANLQVVKVKDLNSGNILKIDIYE